MNSFENSILRVLRGDTAVGAAFLVSDRLVVTCAHVVKAAGAEVGGKISLQLTDGKQIQGIVEPEFWRDSNAEDISILRLENALENIQSVIFGSSSGTRGHKFSTFGFPKYGQELSGGGEIIGQANIGGIKLLQLRSPEVTPGFSGAPIFNDVTKRVVAMVVAITPPDEYQRLGTTAFAVPSETIREICSELQISDICPYRSLDVFNEEDAPFFFGRDRVVQKMINSLKREPRFLAVLGPSGSGKSSVVRAGLIPVLKQGKVLGSDKWGVITIRPASQPFEQLDSTGLSKSQDGLKKAVRTWLEEHPQKTHVVLAIDQFEEVLVSTPEDIRQNFIKELSHLMNAPIAITVIITLRDDFYSRFLQDAAVLTSWLERGLVNIPKALDNDELQAMIVEPARMMGLNFEGGLVDDIISDTVVADRTKEKAVSTILPLLEFALTELWEKRQDGQLTHNTYHAIGGVTGGLAQWADQAYYALDANERKLAKYIFSELVHLGDEKVQTPETRRVIPINELSLRRQKGNIEAVVSKLVQARLLSTQRDLNTGQELIEIIHEALLREWELLKTWVDDFRNREKRNRERQQRRVTLGLAIGFLVMLALTIYAGLQWRRANEQRNIALARQLHTQAQSIMQKDATIGTLLAIEATNLAPSLEGQWILESGLAKIPQRFLSFETEDRNISSFSPDRKFFITEPFFYDNLTVVDLQLGQKISQILAKDVIATAFVDNETVYTFDKTGRIIYWDIFTGKAISSYKYDYQSYGEITQVSSDLKFAIAEKSNSDNKAFRPASITVFELPTGREMLSYEYSPFYENILSEDGKLLFVEYNTKDSEYKREVWDLGTGQILLSLDSYYSDISDIILSDIIFSTNNEFIAFRYDHGVSVWDIPNRREMLRVDDPKICMIDLIPSGELLATFNCGHGIIKVWSVQSGNVIWEMFHSTYDINYDYTNYGGCWPYALAFNGNGLLVAGCNNFYTETSSRKSLLNIWQLESQHKYMQIETPEAITAISFSKSGELVSTGGLYGRISIWNAATGYEYIHMEDPDRSTIMTVNLSSDNNLIMSLSETGKLRVWETNKQEKIFEADASNFYWKGAHFLNQDTQVIAIDYGDDGITTWDIGNKKDLSHSLEGFDIVTLSTNGLWALVRTSPWGESFWNSILPRDSWLVAHAKTGIIIGVITPNDWLISERNSERAVAVSDSGKLVAIGYEDRVVRVFNILRRQESFSFAHDFGEIHMLAFSEDNKYLISGGQDGTVRVIETKQGHELARAIYRKAIQAVAIDPTNRFIAFSTEDRELVIWNWTAENLIERICFLLPRNLTRSEWKQYIGDILPYHATCPYLSIEQEVTITSTP